MVAIPAGTTYARFSLFDDFTDGNDDLDMCVFNSANALVGASGGGTSAEKVNLRQSGGRQLHGRRAGLADGWT